MKWNRAPVVSALTCLSLWACGDSADRVAQPADLGGADSALPDVERDVGGDADRPDTTDAEPEDVSPDAPDADTADTDTPDTRLDTDVPDASDADADADTSDATDAGEDANALDEPPTDVEVRLEPAELRGGDRVRAVLEHDHPTATFTFAWTLDAESLAQTGPELDVPTEAVRGEVLQVEVTATTSGGTSGPFVASGTIANSPPVLRALRIEPREPLLDDVLRALGTIEDNDGEGDAQLAACRWQRFDAEWVDLDGDDGESLGACAQRPGCAVGHQYRAICVARDGFSDSPEVMSDPVTIGCGARDPRCQPARDTPPTVDALDYGYWYWPTNHRPGGYEREMHFLSGHYGMVLNEETGELARFGWLDDDVPMGQAGQRGNDAVLALPQAELAFEAGPADDPARITGFAAPEGHHDDRAFVRDSGRFMNFIELPLAQYANTPVPLSGRVDIAAMPRHVVFNHTVDTAEARIVLGGDFLTPLTAQWQIPDRAVTLTDDQGSGWLVVAYGPNRLALNDDRLTATHSAEPGQTHTVSLLAAPLGALTEDEIALYLQPAEAVEAQYTLLDVAGEPVTAPTPIAWDRTLGAFRADLGTLAQAGLGGPRDYDARPELHNWYGRHRLEVDTHGRELAVPMAFFGTGGASMNITGGAPILRSDSGEPVGVPIQISKNWHDQMLGQWYHLYTQPNFSGVEASTLEFTVASSRWGADAYAASHAQLSLIGWSNAGGHWDESALGAFGESITYDPDVVLGRAMVDDVRPALVDARDRWTWTGNVGGADFLRYSAAQQPGVIRRLGRVRSTYYATGPALTDVAYSGVTGDGRIQATLRTQLGRTDDMVRVWYHLDYTFLQDVRYDRLAFFQMAADRYGDNGFAHVAWGNADGVTQTRDIPDHRTTGYASPDDRGIPLEGASPWVMLYDNQRTQDPLPEHYADLAYVVRDFEARIGEQVIETPHLSLHRTFNGNSQFGLELGLPYDPDAVIPAGSTVRATVEYLVPPADKEVYYGDSDWLEALPAPSWRTPAMGQRLAAGGALAVTATTGELRRAHPVEIDAAPGPVAAQFTVRGGLGFVPVTFHGLPRHDGWRLQRASGPIWVPVDQSVHGNDYWQTRWDGVTGTYSLTYNLPNREEQRYRLIWGGQEAPLQGPFAAENRALQVLEDAGPPPLRADDATPTLVEVSAGETRAVYLDSIDYEGSSTRVYAWLGIPEGASIDEPVPAVVLVHGGGGTAFQEWVQRWTDRGYAAISIAVEGQTDTVASPEERDAGLAVGNWRKHGMPGPARAGIYGDTDQPVQDQWMYHAVAATVLAGALMRSLPEVDGDAVGLMGISWGGVIASTVLGVDSRFAFAVPVYGNGHKYDIPNYFGLALADNQLYRGFWDPVLRMDRVTTPTLWLSWPQENAFSLDSQAATYLAAPGPRMVSLVPDMGHGHWPGWQRPESYAFADSVVQGARPWAEQESVNESDGVAEAVFRSSRPLMNATLIYTTGSGYTGDLDWVEVPVDALVEEPLGTWTARVALPAQTTAWFINALAPDADVPLVLSSDYQERIAVSVVPGPGLDLSHPEGIPESVGRLQVGFTGPSYLDVVEVTIGDESHPGAFAVPEPLPWVLEEALPATSGLAIVFDDARAQLAPDEVASCRLTLRWAGLDGTLTALEVPVTARLVPNVPVVFDQDADWSSENVFTGAHVTIAGGAYVLLDEPAQISTLTVDDGVLEISNGMDIALTEELTLGADGAVRVTDGRLLLHADSTRIDGVLTVDGGVVRRDMEGVGGRLHGAGRVEVLSGHFDFSGGAPVNVLVVDVDFHISGGRVDLTGQIYVGQQRDTLFEVLGSDAEIHIFRFNTAGGRRGTYRFVLDELGVSPVQIPGWMNFGFAAVEVDGTSYAGGPQTLPLFDSSNLVEISDPGGFQVLGFDDNGLQADIVQDQQVHQVLLVIAPE